MKERPILFSAQMVRALLAGTKTQTRRIMKPQPADDIAPANFPNHLVQGWVSTIPHKYGNTVVHRCPYGQAGDRLWVREKFAEADLPDGTPVIAYCAGGCIPVGRKDDQDYLIHDWAIPDAPEPDRWKPSIHMPRWASRITLEITGVRVERLQSISEADAEAEGAYPTLHPLDSVRLGATGTSKEGFRQIFEYIKGAGSWGENPFVFVIELERVGAV
jgi:hypothetical protein